jgi:hypothetical protein
MPEPPPVTTASLPIKRFMGVPPPKSPRARFQSAADATSFF